MAFTMQAHTNFVVHQHLHCESIMKHQLPFIHHNSKAIHIVWHLGFHCLFTIHHHYNVSIVDKTESNSQSIIVLEFLLYVVFVVDYEPFEKTQTSRVTKNNVAATLPFALKLSKIT